MYNLKLLFAIIFSLSVLPALTSGKIFYLSGTISHVKLEGTISNCKIYRVGNTALCWTSPIASCRQIASYLIKLLHPSHSKVALDSK